jgi:hypothetical protein
MSLVGPTAQACPFRLLVDLRGKSRPRTAVVVTPPLVPSSPMVLQRLPQNEQCEKAHSQFNISPLLRCYLNPLQITIFLPPHLGCLVPTQLSLSVPFLYFYAIFVA